MRILIAADIFPPQPGGPATYSVVIANELTKAGDDVKVVSLNPDSDKKAVICKIDVVKNRNKFLKYLEYTWLLVKNAKKFDVIYAMGPVNAGFPALIASKLTGKRLITKIVGDYAWEQGVQRFGVVDSIDEFQKNQKYSMKIKILRFIEKTVAKNSNTVIVPSVYLKGLVMGWGLSGHCVTVVFNSSSYVDICDVLKPEEEKWIISAGRLVPWKGMEALIEVMSNILKKFTNAKLKIFGSGPCIKKLRNKVVELKLESSVEIPGQLARKDLMCQINKADIFILNSAYEGLSHLLLEALHVNTPVLASKAGGNAELVYPGKNGDLFELGNKKEIEEKILSMLDGSQKLDWPQEEKEEFFEKFSLNSMVKNTRQSLQNVCSSQDGFKKIS
ncbi:MAG: glycosyltransferase family 4 protein [bacterium]|nr:glycosyltransferase family 4 protein [bacterium]